MYENKWRSQDAGDKKENEYAHRTTCRNCGERIYIWITKGHLIKDILSSVKCPKCEVFQLGSY